MTTNRPTNTASAASSGSAASPTHHRSRQGHAASLTPEATPLRQSARDLVHSWGDLTAWLASQQDKQESMATLQIILGQSDIRYTAPDHQAWYRQQIKHT